MEQALERQSLHADTDGMPEQDGMASASPADQPSFGARRRFRRWSVNLTGRLLAGGEARPCAVYDVSPGGARVQVSEGDEVAVGRRIILDLDGFGDIPAEVRHSADGFLGLGFTHGPDDEVRFARHLVACKPPRRHERQRVAHAASIRASGLELPCAVTNISRTGAAVMVDDTQHFMIGDEVALTLDGRSVLMALVRHVDVNTVGLRLIDEYDAL